jgi:hypothetical protein
MSKKRYRNVDFKIDERDSTPPYQLPFWQKVINVLLVFITIANFVIIIIFYNKTGNLNKQIASRRETVNLLEKQNVSLKALIENQKARFEEFLENHRIIKKSGKFEYESVRGTKKDKDGTPIVGLEIDILSERYRWMCGNFDRIIKGDKEYDPEEIFRVYVENGYPRDSKGLVCIGMASTEGKRGNEEERAERRMEKLIYAARKAHVDGPIYGLNLGQYIGKGETSCSGSTLWQRRVVLLKVIKQIPSISDKELKDGIISILEEKARNKHIVFPFDIRDYSKYRNGRLALTYGSIGK